MKKCFSLLLIAVLMSVRGSHCNATTPDTSAFRDLRFGLFIHYGLYAQLGGRWQDQTMDYIGEWVQSKYRIPNAVYSRLAKEFNPQKFDADEWARQAKEAGMEYVVFTTKHHEGFAMFASKVSDYNIVDATPFGRDLFGELVAACRRHGLKVGLYYSQCLDWHEKDAADDVKSRGTNKGMDWGNSWDWPDASQKDIHRYLKAKVYPQLKELLTNYGEIFYIWFDTPQSITAEDAKQLKNYVRSLQPNVLVNSRIGFEYGDVGSLRDNQTTTGKSDYALESPMTLNDTWGFKYDDHNWKKGYDVACILSQTIACNANLLLNIGPRADGRFPDAASDVLAELGAWRRATGFAIYGSQANPFPSSFDWGWCMVAPGNVLQLTVKREWNDNISLSGIRNKVKACSHEYSLKDGVLTIKLPTQTSSMPRVVRIELEGAPDIEQLPMPQGGVLSLQPASGKASCLSADGMEVKVGDMAPERTSKSGCCITQRGAFTAWHHAGDKIEWEAMFPAEGEYKVVVCTESWVHGQAWKEDREVELNVGGNKLSGTLAKDVLSPSSKVYEKVESVLGIVKVPAGKTTISLKTLSATSDAQHHDLTLLRLEKVR